MKERKNVGRLLIFCVAFTMFLAVVSIVPTASAAPMTFDFGDVSLTSSGATDAGHFSPVFDLTKCDMTLSFTYDANGLVDDFGGSAHGYGAFGIREVGYGDFNPTWMVEGAGVWLATDYEWSVNTFDPDPVGSPTLDNDDKLILQKGGGLDESSYNILPPSVYTTPPNPWANHAVWFDRDGVDPWQAAMWGCIDGVTYNTAGLYDIVITLHATSATAGTATMTINGEPQGFYDPAWHSGPVDLTPAGMTFTGDMTQQQVYYGLYGYGASHSVAFNDILVNGCPACTDEVWVDDDYAGSTPGDIVDGHTFGYDAFATIQDGVDAVCGSTVYVAAGTYTETVTLDKTLNLVGAGCDTTIWQGTTITSRSLHIIRNSVTPADIHVEISGFSFETENTQSIYGHWSTSYTQALTLDIHDNCFAHVNSRNPGNDFGIYINGANQVPRSSQGAIRIYDNIFDVVTGAMCIENSRAVDVIDNIFNVTYEGVDFNYLVASETFGEQLIKGNVFTHVPVDWAFAMNNYHAGDGSYTILPSEVCNNIVTDTGFSYTIVYGVQVHQSSVHDFTIFDNALLSGTIIAWGGFESEVVLDASGNWWGSAASPIGRINTAGTVDYTPWLDVGVDTSSDPGFQGDFSELWVDDDSPQTGTVGRIQEGVDMVNDYGTVNVNPGNYDGGITIDKSLTMIGAGQTQTIIDTSSSPVITVSADDVTIQDLGITDSPYLVEGIRVVSPAASGLTVDNVAFTDLGAGTGANAYGIYIATSFSDLSVVGCEFTSIAHASYYRTIGIFAPNNLNLNDFEVLDSTFTTIWTGIYLRSEITGFDIINNIFQQQQLTDTGGCAAGVYIGDGSDYNFDIQDIEIADNTFTDFIRGVYVWNYANDAVIGSFNIHDNTFTDALWSSPIRFIAGNAGDENVAYQGPITIEGNTFTQTAELTPGANVATIDFRSYCEHPSCDVSITNNEIIFSGSYTHAKYAIRFGAFADAFTNILIENNIINGGNVLDGKTGTIPSSGLLIDHYSSSEWPSDMLTMDILNNEIIGFDHGISIYDYDHSQYGGLATGSDVNIHCNEIYDNALYGVRNDNAETVDATCNWWGDCTGPSGEGPGVGDSVSTNVVFDPWVGQVIADAGGPYYGSVIQFDGAGFVSCGCGMDSIVSYLWDFGDGTTSTEEDPVHIYSEDDTYQVTLTVATSMGCSDVDTTLVYVEKDDGPIIVFVTPEEGEYVDGTYTVSWYAIDDDYPGNIGIPIWLYYRPESAGSDAWRQIGDEFTNNVDIEHGEYRWDTSGYADDAYYLRAMSCDGDSNYAEDTILIHIDNGNAGVRVSDVEIFDDTVSTTGFVKDGDTVVITAGITGRESSSVTLDDVTADLSGFGLGASVHPDSFDGFIASWTLVDVVCTPSDGPLTVSVSVFDSVHSTTIIADNTVPEVTMLKPLSGVYLYGYRVLPFGKTFIIGSVDVEVGGSDDVVRAEFFVDGVLLESDSDDLVWTMNIKSMVMQGMHELVVVVYDGAGNAEQCVVGFTMVNPFGLKW